MSKNCINCGAELSDNAAFCPHCETKQTEKQTIKVPKRWRKRAVTALILVVLLAACVFVIYKAASPKTYEGGAEIVYQDRERSYHALLTFNMPEERYRRTPMETKEVTIPAGSGYGAPSHLYVYDENSDDDVQDEFMKKVVSCTVESVPLTGGNPMEILKPEYTQDFPYATRTATVIYNVSCGTNEIRWTLQMENGDTVILRQTLVVHEQPSIQLYPDDADMSTSEELQTLLDSISADDLNGKIISIYLPEAIYTSSVTLPGGTINLYPADDEHPPVFERGIVAQSGTVSCFGIVFDGDGGTGITATCPTMLYDCIFTGWDTGALAEEGSWIAAHGCVFESNGIGLYFNSEKCPFSNAEYDNNTFAGNDIGILLESVPKTQMLRFPGTSFTDNGEDIKNLCQQELDTDLALFQ